MGMMGKSIVVHEGICVSGTEINTTCLAKFLLHSNQGRKNRSCVCPGKVSNADGAQGKTEELESISRFYSSASSLGGKCRKYIPLRILAVELFYIYTLNAELELQIF